MKARFRDLTPTDVVVLSDLVKDQGLGLTPAAYLDLGRLGYLCYQAAGLEGTFIQVFPHTLGRVKSACGNPSRLVWLMEAQALRAVLRAFGLEGHQVAHYVHAAIPMAGFVRMLEGRKYLGA